MTLDVTLILSSTTCIRRTQEVHGLPDVVRLACLGPENTDVNLRSGRLSLQPLQRPPDLI
jgi:hypothetical protein